MSDVKFIEQGNTSIIDEVCSPASKIPMIRYETLVDFCVNEPALIHVLKNRTCDKIVCEQIFKMIVDIPNDHLIAFTIYANERENFTQDCCMVIRQIFWDKQIDIKNLKQFPERRTDFLMSWPSIKSKNIVFGENVKIIKVLNDIDKIINHGLILQNRTKNESLSWRDIEIMRRYDWGEIRTSWGTFMQNIQIEHYLFDVMNHLEIEMTKESSKAYKIELDYKIPLDLYQKIICGQGRYSG